MGPSRHNLRPIAWIVRFTASASEAATFSSGNSPMTSQSGRPKVKYQPISLPPTALEEVGDGLVSMLRFSQHALDCASSEATTRDVDGHGISADYIVLLSPPWTRNDTPAPGMVPASTILTRSHRERHPSCREPAFAAYWLAHSEQGARAKRL